MGCPVHQPPGRWEIGVGQVTGFEFLTAKELVLISFRNVNLVQLKKGANDASSNCGSNRVDWKGNR